MAYESTARAWAISVLILPAALAGCTFNPDSDHPKQTVIVGLSLDLATWPGPPGPFAEPEAERSYWMRWMNETVEPQLGCDRLASYPTSEPRVLAQYVRLKGACTIIPPAEAQMGSLPVHEKIDRLSAALASGDGALAEAFALLESHGPPGNATGWALHSYLIHDLVAIEKALERSKRTLSMAGQASGYSLLTASANASTAGKQAEFVSVFLRLLSATGPPCNPIPAPPDRLNLSLVKRVTSEMDNLGLSNPWGVGLENVARRVDDWAATNVSHSWTYDRVNDMWRNLVEDALNLARDRTIPSVEEADYLVAQHRAQGRDEIKEDIIKMEFSSNDSVEWPHAPDKGLVIQSLALWRWPYEGISCA